jgi:hypothetical protein
MLHETIGEAQEPIGWLTATCILAVSLGVEVGCNEGVLERICPAGTTKLIRDTWDKTKFVAISCNLLHDLLCGTAAVSAVELMRSVCLRG